MGEEGPCSCFSFIIIIIIVIVGNTVVVVATSAADAVIVAEHGHSDLHYTQTHIHAYICV